MTSQPKTQVARAAARRSIFADGQIVSDAGSSPVRIRNMSEVGALVDCKGDLPAVGEVVHLEKGRHSLLATVSWSKGSRAGLTFAVQANLADWLSQSAGPKGSNRSRPGRQVADKKAEDSDSSERSRLERDRIIVARLTEAATLLDSVLAEAVIDNSPRRRGPTARQQVECSLALVNELIDVVARSSR